MIILILLPESFLRRSGYVITVMISVMNLHFGKWDWFSMGFSNLVRNHELRLIWVWMWVCGPQALPVAGGLPDSHGPRSRWVRIQIEDSSLAKSGLPWRNSGHHSLWVRKPLWMCYQYVNVPVAQAKPTPVPVTNSTPSHASDSLPFTPHAYLCFMYHLHPQV